MGKTLKCMLFGLLLVVIAISVGCGTQAPEAEQTSEVPQAADPFTGTWQLNVEKSAFPGSAPRALMRTVEDRGDGMIVMTREGIDAQGNRTFEQYAAKRDGNDYPHVVLGAQLPRSISLKRVDQFTEESIKKADGKVTVTRTHTVSTDGKTLTIAGKAMNSQGEETTIVQVFERQ